MSALRDDDLYSPALAKTMKRQIDHRLAIIERAVLEMKAIVPGHPMQAQLRDIHDTARNMKLTIDERTRKPKT